MKCTKTNAEIEDKIEEIESEIEAEIAAKIAEIEEIGAEIEAKTEEEKKAEIKKIELEEKIEKIEAVIENIEVRRAEIKVDIAENVAEIANTKALQKMALILEQQVLRFKLLLSNRDFELSNKLRLDKQTETWLLKQRCDEKSLLFNELYQKSRLDNQKGI